MKEMDLKRVVINLKWGYREHQITIYVLTKLSIIDTMQTKVLKKQKDVLIWKKKIQ